MIRRQLHDDAIFNLFSGCSGAFSLRKVMPLYAGNCIRVRRDSDNTETDIPFLNGSVDTATLLAFCGAGSGYVTTWYDQSGNGRNAVQVTAASQPRIVNAGVVETIGGKPAIHYLGAQFLSAGDNFDIRTTNLNVYAVSELSVNGTIYAKSLSSTAAGRYSLLYSATSSNTLFLSQLTTVNTTNPVNVAYSSGRKLWRQNIRWGNGNYAYINGAAVGSYTASVESIDFNTAYRFLLGAYNNATDTGQMNFLNGMMQEIIIFNNAVAPRETAINGNINNYYNIY